LYQSLLSDARFHDLLLAFDRDLADAARSAGCALCNGVVHSARYWRKPRGRACSVGSEHNQRFSFCCAVDGCRSRTTPPSLRFLGRKVYLATIVVLVSMMRHGVTEPRVRHPAAAVGVDRRTDWRNLSHRREREAIEKAAKEFRQHNDEADRERAELPHAARYGGR
jgi:hypothetical protein